MGDKKKCDPTFHRYYSLDPMGVESTGAVLVISICSNCGDVLEHRTQIFTSNEEVVSE